MKILITILFIFLTFNLYSQRGDIRFTINCIEANYPPLSSMAAKKNFKEYCNQLLSSNEDRDEFCKGYVIEPRTPNLKPGMVCCSFEQEKGGIFNANYISTVDRYRVYARSYFRNDSIIITGSYDKWRKLNNYTPGYLKKLPLYNRKAEFRKLTDKSFLIRIPENSYENVTRVDSLAKLYKDDIEKTETLIIDVRNNDGGTVSAYYPLLPFIYTNPIKTVNASLYCSPGGIKDYEQSFNDYMISPKVDSNVAALYRKTLVEMKAKPGIFILYPGDTIKYDNIKEYPKNVAIITNHGTLSAAELMLLDFRQSKKVKLFGENSGGAVDHLDYYHVMSPSKKYWLYIPKKKDDNKRTAGIRWQRNRS